jgi:hypothetical protein
MIRIAQNILKKELATGTPFLFGFTAYHCPPTTITLTLVIQKETIWQIAK